MTSSNSATKGLERLLSDYPPEVAELTVQVREAILSVMPDAVEKVYFGWRGLGFHHPTAGYVCAIFPSSEDIRIAFEHGNLLHDPDQRLEGSGKQVRYLTLSAWDPALPEVLSNLIDQAIQLR